MSHHAIFTKLTQRIATAVAFGIIALAPFTPLAQASAVTYPPCGSVCNGKPASFRSCANYAHVINTKVIHPNSAQVNREVSSFNDPYITVHVWYSTRCQTIWADVTVTKTIGRSECEVILSRFSVNRYDEVYACPKTHQKLTTAMVNDNDPHHNPAASAEVDETRASDGFESRFWVQY